MTRLSIVPTVPEYGVARAQYEALADALREQGYDARVERPGGGVEERGLPAEALQAAHDVAVIVYGELREEALGALAMELLRRLRRKTKRRRRAVIYGPRGEVLRRVELPPSDAE